MIGWCLTDQAVMATNAPARRDSASVPNASTTVWHQLIIFRIIISTTSVSDRL
jgi:hypothetical protein